MPTLSTVMADLKSRASDQTRKTFLRHGAPVDNTLGVSIADLKIVAKGLKKQQALALEIYATGTFEAQYLAGMVADGALMTKKQLQSWVEAATSPMIHDTTIQWVAIENPAARELALEWMKSKKDHISAAGWRTYAGLVITRPDDELDLKEIEALLKTIANSILKAANRTRAAMNGFMISVGTYVAPLLEQANATAKQIGAVPVDVGDTACEIPLATHRIAKAHASGRTAKRKTVRC